MTPLPSSSRRFASASNAGFTLTELAVVLVIVALLVGGLVVPLTAQVDLRNVADTRRSLAEIREAMLGYAAVNGRLPCPAPAAVASGVAGAGLEGPWAAATGCTNLSGVVPWATLGIPETDAWGRRFTYRVTMAFTRGIQPAGLATLPECAGAVPPPQNAAFALCSPGNMTVFVTGGGARVAIDLPAVFISHGKNGNGAYSTLGTQLAVGGDADELDNQLTGVGVTMANLNFVYKTPTDTFDDELGWMPAPILFSRMIRAGKLP